MEEQQTPPANQEKEKLNLNEIAKKKIDFQKLFPKKIKIDRLQVRQRYAFTHAGKTKKG